MTLFASIATSTAVVGLDPAETGVTDSPASVADSEPGSAEPAVAPEIQIPDDDCSVFLADYCVEVPIRNAVDQPRSLDEVNACSTENEHQPGWALEVVAAPASPPPLPDAIQVRIEVESGLAIDSDCFADEVLSILSDPRGWLGVDGVAFQQTDGDGYDLRLILASPGRTDALCHPARTVGRFSCRKQDSVILNLMRWESGTDDYSDDLSTYRTYLVNHEVGHFLGRGHVHCPGPGEPAPVMMQQTKGLGECEPNGWPTKDES